MKLYCAEMNLQNRLNESVLFYANTIKELKQKVSEYRVWENSIVEIFQRAGGHYDKLISQYDFPGYRN